MTALLRIRMQQLSSTQGMLDLDSDRGQASGRFDLPWIDDNEWRVVFLLLEAYRNAPFTWLQGDELGVAYAARTGLTEGHKPASDRAAKIGQMLYDSLFNTDKLRNLITEATGNLSGEGVPVVQLRIESSDSILQAYPWELLHNGEGFLFDSRRASLARYIHFSEPLAPSVVTETLQILAVYPRPSLPAHISSKFANLPDLDKPILNNIVEVTGKRLALDNIERVPGTSTFQAINDYLTLHPGKTNVVHIDAHGAFGFLCSDCGTFNTIGARECHNCDSRINHIQRPQGYVAFEQGDGAVIWISGSQLGNLLRRRGVQLVVLSACKTGLVGAGSTFNSVAGALIQSGVPAVVAMQFSVEGESTRKFMHSLYTALSTYEPLVEAVATARTVLSEYDDAWYRPVLYLRSDERSYQGQIFVPPTTADVQQKAVIYKDSEVHFPSQDDIAKHLQSILEDFAHVPGVDFHLRGVARRLPISAYPYEQIGPTDHEYDLVDHIRENQRLIVLGDPGSGKTVALLHYAWKQARERERILPIYIALLDYAGQDFIELIRNKLHQAHEPLHFGDRIDLEGFLTVGSVRCHFLFDGLNEVRHQYRDRLLSELSSFPFGRNYVTLTSRIQDEAWRRLRLSMAFPNVAVVRPIKIDQVFEYLNAFLSSERVAEFKQILEADSRLTELLRTPLLLWLAKEAALLGGRFPRNRGELYRSFVDHLIRRDEDKIPLEISRSERLETAQLLALEMQERHTLTISSEAASTLINKANGALIIKALLTNGLLQGEEQLRFGPHQTMQEYFAATLMLPNLFGELKASSLRQMLFRVGQREDWLGLLVQKFGWHAKNLLKANDSWWAETFIQLAGIAEEPELLIKGLASYNPWLSWWCVQEGRSVDLETQRAVEHASYALIRSSEVIDRQRAAEALSRILNVRTIPLLALLAWDVDWSVAQIAVGAIANYGEEGFNEFLRAIPQTVKDIDSLAQIVSAITEWHHQAKLADNLYDAFCNSTRVSVTSFFLNTKMSPLQRAKAGDILATIGDRRAGVGLDEQGLPEVAWCKVTGGTLIIGGKVFQVRPFLISKYLVTYSQFQAFINAPDGWRNKEWWRFSEGAYKWRASRQAPSDAHWTTANRPRERVCWYEAVAYCAWLSSKLDPDVFKINDVTTWSVRLPSEAEWQAAASQKLEYCWGPLYKVGYANCDETYHNAGPHYLQQTCAVGMYLDAKAQCGALDMHGNVWEYVATDLDCSDACTIHSEHIKRVVRGGSWYSSHDELPGYRDWVHVGDFNAYDGFRVCSSNLALLAN